MALVLTLCGAGRGWCLGVAATWCWGGALWFKRDAERTLSQLLAQAGNADYSADIPPQLTVCPSWVAGWYWETDAQHRLTVFKQGQGFDEGLTVDWQTLAEFVGQRPLWSHCWPSESVSVGTAQARGRVALALDQGSRWDEGQCLPWPSALPGLVPHATHAMCTVRMAPRATPEGQFAGHCGVLTLLPAAAAAPQGLGQGAVALADAPVALAAAPATPTGAGCEEGVPMSDGEQEVLRYALSHDLRAPLRVVDGFVRIVKEDYGQALDRIGNDHLDRVLAAAGRMNGMIDAILAQAQLAGTPLVRVAVDVTAEASEVGSELAKLLPDGVVARVDVQPGLVAQADPLLLRRILENLIGNALKYSAKVASPRVEVGAMAATNPTVFYVRDNGAGFDMQHADKLFGLFQRLHSAKEFPGTGVGLAGVQNIVRRHGGRVWAEARPGYGACFYFTLMDAAQAQRR